MTHYIACRIHRRKTSALLAVTALLAMRPAFGDSGEEKEAGFPKKRRAHSRVVYDSNRDVAILFGRSDEGETWEWNGQNWVRRSTDGPGPRRYYAMSFDAQRGVAVLFGGLRDPESPGGRTSGDTWEWDGKSWSHRSSEGPGARCCHSMVYDERHGTTLLFGGHGQDGALMGDTWEWDGERWALTTDTGPSPRTGHSMAYDSNRQVVWLVGGIDRRGIDEFQTGTWAWDGWSWKRIAAAGPPLHYGATLVFDEPRKLTFLWGGWGLGDELRDELWQWDGKAWRASQALARPPARGKPVYDSSHDRFLLFSASESSDVCVADVWELQTAGWKRKSAPSP